MISKRSGHDDPLKQNPQKEGVTCAIQEPPHGGHCESARGEPITGKGIGRPWLTAGGN